MKKAIIFGHVDFPRGSASANYVQHLAVALKLAGYVPLVVSNGDVSRCTRDEQGFSWEGVRFVPYPMAKCRLLHYVQFRVGLGYTALAAIRRIGCNPGDWLIAYSLKATEMEPVFRYARRRNIHTVACVPELFPPSFFRRGEKDPRWRDFHRGIVKSIPMAQKVWPVSRLIEQTLAPFGCDCLRLPPMVDTAAVLPDWTETLPEEPVRMIFPGAGVIKDALREMVLAVGRIQARVEFHVTGVSADCFAEDAEIAPLLGKRLMLHGWMDYAELQALYRRMDFLFLARETNQLTLANFPSKVPEAMAYGVIPVMSRVGDCAQEYLVDGENALLFEGASVESCVAVLERVCALSWAERARLRWNARKTAEERFDPRVWAEAIRRHLEGAAET